MGNSRAPAGVDLEVVEDAETDAHKRELRELEHLAFILGLDPVQLSGAVLWWVGGTAGGDSQVGELFGVADPPLTLVYVIEAGGAFGGGVMAEGADEPRP